MYLCLYLLSVSSYYVSMWAGTCFWFLFYFTAYNSVGYIMRNLLNIWSRSAWNPSHPPVVCSLLGAALSILLSASFGLVRIKHGSWCCNSPYSKPPIVLRMTSVLKYISLNLLTLIQFVVYLPVALYVCFFN